MPARGLTTFARMHLRDGLTADGARLISAESARLMRAPQVELRPSTDRRRSQGSGWQLSSPPSVAEHSGDAPGEHLEPQVRELRRLDGQTFACVGADGQAAGAVEFLETDDQGRARYVHSGRAAPRVD